MNTPDCVAAVLASAEAGGIHNAELAALRRRLRQLGDLQAGLLPGAVLQPVADLPRLDELPEPPPGRPAGGRQAERRAGDEHGPAGAEVAAGGQAWHELP